MLELPYGRVETNDFFSGLLQAVVRFGKLLTDGNVLTS